MVEQAAAGRMIDLETKAAAGTDREVVNILLVDDRPNGLMVLEAVLASPEYNLCKAQSGAEALERLRDYDYAVILLDVQMPEMDGFETAKLIKENERAKDTPIIFVTAISTEASHIQRGYESGAVDYIFKPFDPYTLKSKVAVFADLYRKKEKIRRQGILIQEMERKERERKIAELELESARRYRNLADAIPHIVWKAQPDGITYYFNHIWLDYSGLSLDQSTGWGWLAMMHPEERTAFVAEWNLSKSNHTGFEMECRLRNRNGIYRWHLVRVVPETELDRLVAWIGTSTDIHDRVEADLRLRRSESNLSDFFENASIALHWVGPDGIILRVNQAELKMLGYSREEYVGKHIAGFHVDQEVIEDILARLSRNEVISNYEARLRCKDGSIKHALIDSSVLWENGKFIHTRCFTRDVTEQKKTQEALRQKEERLSLAQAASGFGAFDWDVANDRIVWSAELEKIYGFEPGTAPASFSEWQKLVFPHDRELMKNRTLESLHEKTDFVCEFRIFHQSGRLRWIAARGKPHFDSHGKPVRFIGTNIDITDKKLNEQRVLAQYSVTKILAHSEKLIDAVPEILASLCKALDWEFSALWSVDRKANLLRCVETWHDPAYLCMEFDTVTRQHVFEPGRGLPGRVWAQKEGCWVELIADDENLPRKKWAVDDGFVSAAAFPIRIGDDVLGVIEFFSTRHQLKDPDLLAMTEAVGGQIGQFIHRRRAEEELRQAHDELEHRVRERTAELSIANLALKKEMEERMRAQADILEISDREQKRIGQDLHDGLAQKLAAVSFLTKSLEQKLLVNSPAEAETLREILSLMKETIIETRRLSRGFYPIELEKNGFYPALQELAVNKEKLFNVECDYDFDPAVEVKDLAVAGHLYRIAQEAIHNAIKHGKAKKIRLSVENGGEEAVLKIEDDGIGIPKQIETFDGMGMRIMRYRAKMIGGLVDIARLPKKGSRVICRFPSPKAKS